MAQSFDVRPDTTIVLDEYDEKFIAQAEEHGIKKGSAIRARYTTLIEDQAADGSTVRFPVAGRRKWKEVRIDHTYLSELVAKLRSLDLHETTKFGLKVFEREDARNFLKRRHMVLDYQVRRNPKTRDIKWEEYGGDIDQAMDKLMDNLGVDRKVRTYWQENRYQVKSVVQSGIRSAFGRRPYEGEDKDDIFRRVLGYVLLNGEKQDEQDNSRVVLHQQQWIWCQASKQFDMEMKKRHGPRENWLPKEGEGTPEEQEPKSQGEIR